MAEPPSVADRIKRISDLAGRGLHREALAASEAGLAIAPAIPAFGLLKGVMLLELGQYDQAVRAVDRVIGAGHILAPAFVVRGHALWRLGRKLESVESLKRAIVLNPSDHDTHDSLGRKLLSLGDFDGGWQQREHRRAVLKPLACKAPRWNGEELSGKRLLVAAEEGLGDTVMFARYFELLRARGARVTAIVQRPLLRLFQSSDGLTAWTTDMATTGDFDFQIDLLSLPLLFKTRLETIPAKVPYIVPEPELVAAWAKAIGPQGFKIGIVWETGKSTYADQGRCIPLSAFAALGDVPGVRLISLQAVNGLDQLSNLPAGMVVERLGNAVELNRHGISEIAAAMQSLDLVVAADTMAAHLAGALARPVWLALMHDAEWRWLRDRTGSPWYPTMRLFRQKTPDDWPGIFAEMGEELTAMRADEGRARGVAVVTRG